MSLMPSDLSHAIRQLTDHRAAELKLLGLIAKKISEDIYMSYDYRTIARHIHESIKKQSFR